MPASTASTHLSPAELSYLHTSLSTHPAIRPDSRTATDFRPLHAETSMLPNTMGSAHVGFADGREAVVGVRAEVEKTAHGTGQSQSEGGDGEDVEMVDSAGQIRTGRRRGKADWVTLGLTLPGLRDDDKDLVFLEEMLRETLVVQTGLSTRMGGDDTGSGHAGASCLQDALVINHRYHWHLYIDVLLISSPDSGSSNFPLPLLSMATHLALRNTKLPRLKSEGDEDPVADDDWDAAVWLYGKGGEGNRRKALLRNGVTPPVTLLVMVVGENVIFDPSGMELGVADGVVAVSVGRGEDGDGDGKGTVKIVAVRSLETPARDTMKGVARDVVEGGELSGSGTDAIVPGVWKPKVGGIKRAVLMKVLKTVVAGGVGTEVLEGLDGFLSGA